MRLRQFACRRVTYANENKKNDIHINKTQSSIQLHDHHTALIRISTLATRFVIDFTRESYDKGRRAYREYDFRTTLTTITRHLFNTSGQYI